MLIYLAILTLSLYFYWHFVHKRHGLPPGPTPIPILGNFHEVLLDPPGEAVYAKWGRQYGDVYTYWMGSLPIVAVTDYKLIMETFQKDGEAYSGRWSFTDFNTMIRGGPHGVIFVDGDLWVEQRRFALKVLRDFGLGRNLMQERVLDEIQTLFSNVDREIRGDQKEHDLCAHVELAVGSIINCLLFGYRFHGDKRSEFFDLKQRAETHVKSLGDPLVLTSMINPNLYKHIPFFKQALKTATDTGQYLVGFFKDRIEDHKKDFNEHEETKDYVHAFLKEWDRREQTNERHFFSNEQLVSMCYDLWLAGQETTATTLAWGFAFIIHHPEVQRKCQEELDRVIASDRIITLSDKSNLHYCNATINEIQRVSNLVPQNVWHRTTKDVVIKGHLIPKGVAILPQISVVLIDEKIYPDPQKFDPKRFLDAEGRLKRVDELIPFSVGKRVCLGESLARMELFLVFVNIINRYELLVGQELPSLKRRFGVPVCILVSKVVLSFALDRKGKQTIEMDIDKRPVQTWPLDRQIKIVYLRKCLLNKTIDFYTRKGFNTYQMRFVFTACIACVLFLLVDAQDRIKGPEFMPWIRRTVDLTNHVPKTFRCSYKKQSKIERERFTATSPQRAPTRGQISYKPDQHKIEITKNPFKMNGSYVNN